MELAVDVVMPCSGFARLALDVSSASTYLRAAMHWRLSIRTDEAHMTARSHGEGGGEGGGGGGERVPVMASEIEWRVAPRS